MKSKPWKNSLVCHKEHATFGPNLATVTVLLDKDRHWAVLHLANKYNEGCLARFLEELIKDALTNFDAEVLEDVEQIKKLRGTH